MISSEVQRTLVKSPPELWAEISDPESLGRHLGELGEIRITRSEPEQLVEWESDDASGTIAIKASGWGTRVTLTAARETATAEDAGPADKEPSRTRAETADATGTADTTTDARSESGEPVEIAEAADAVEISNEPEPEPTAETAEAVEIFNEPETVEPQPAQIADPVVPPATPAGAMSAWAQQETENMPPQAAPEQAAIEPDSVHDPKPVVEPEQPARPVTTALVPAPARRGFLARLFGRRSKLAPPSAPIAAVNARQDAELTIARQAARRRLEATLAVPDVAPTPDLTVAPEPPVEVAPEPAADVAPEPAVEITVEPKPEAESEAEPVAKAQPLAEAVPATEAAPVTEAEAEPGQPIQELAAELREAEETAAEHVTAMLTAALDSLGAAHHRPFSRG